MGARCSIKYSFDCPILSRCTFHTLEIHLQRLIRMFPVAVVLSGCAIGGPRFATPLKMYQGAEKPTTELVSLMVEDMSVNPQNQFERLWTVTVVAVDGQAVPDQGGKPAKVMVLPGNHTVSLACEVQGYRGKRTTTELSASAFAAGSVWYPWARVPMRNGKPLDGTCRGYLKNFAPAMDWDGCLEPAGVNPRCYRDGARP